MQEVGKLEEVLGFDLQIQKGVLYEFTAFKAFQDAWDKQGGMEAFHTHLSKQLS